MNAISRWDLELDNLRAAWRWRESIGDRVGVLRLIGNVDLYWIVRPFGQEVCAKLEENLRVAQDIPFDVRCTAELVAANMAAWLGDYDGGFAHAERGLAAAREIGDMSAIGNAQVLIGVLWEVTGECQRSAEAYREAVAMLRNVPDNFLFGIAMGELGDRLLLCGDIDEGIRLIEEALEQDQRVGYIFVIAIALAQRAHAARLQGDLTMATRLFKKSIVVGREIGDERRILGAFVGLAAVALDEGQPERAARLIGAIEAARESRGVSRVIAHPLHNARIFAAVRERLGDEQYQKLYMEGRAISYDRLLEESLTEV